MATEFKLPDIGEGIAEGEVIQWLIAEGDLVEEDDPLVEVMTDKAIVEIPSPRAGKILQLSAREGDVVAVGATLFVIGDPGEDVSPLEAITASEREKPTASGSDVAGKSKAADAGITVTESSRAKDTEFTVRKAKALARAQRVAAEANRIESTSGPREVRPREPEIKVLATPATRKLARELGVNLAIVVGTGRGGRVSKEDVRQAAGGVTSALRATHPSSAAAAAGSSLESVEHEVAAADPHAAGPSATLLEERRPFHGLRRKIAERMMASKVLIPHYTYVEEVDMTEVLQLRDEAKGLVTDETTSITFLPFIIRALVAALKDHPVLNASLDDEAGEIVVKRYYNIGIATVTERGLIVPVLKSADRLGIFALAREIQRLSGAARAGDVAIDDLRGGTFTVTSTGSIGGLWATPIINHPEVAILGVGAIRKRPVVRDDEVVVRSTMHLSLSADHRVVDGADAAFFVRDLVRYLEDPKLQLLASL